MNKRNLKRPRIFPIVFTVLFAGIWLHSIFLADRLKQLYPSVSIRLNGEGISWSRLSGLQEEERQEDEEKKQPQITAWTVDSTIQAKVRNEILDNEISLLVLLVHGDMSLAAPFSLRAGNYVYGEDTEGCIIDTDSAFKLFGTINAVGNQVFIDEKPYWIRGVVEANKAIAVIQDTGEETIFKNLELVYEDTEWGEKYAKEFILQKELGENAVILDGRFYAKLIHWFVRLPFWILAAVVMIYAIIPLCRAFFAKWMEGRKGEKTGGWLMGFGISALLVWGFSVFWSPPIYLPLRWIPDQWSNFDSYAKTWDSVTDLFKQLHYIQPNMKDVFLLEQLKQSLWESLLACAGLLGAIHFYR